MLTKKQIKVIEETWKMKLETPSKTEKKLKAPDYYFFSRDGERELKPFFEGGKPRKSYEYIEISFIENENCLQMQIDNMNVVEETMKLAKILEVK